MAAPLSIRFDDTVLTRLKQRAASVPGATPSGLAQRLVDEGLRMTDHPRVMFRDGPAGRRAGLIGGPDVWELVTFLEEVDERDAAAVSAAAETFAVPTESIEAGIAYYAAFTQEIDGWIARAREASDTAEDAWRRRQSLLS
ncbi:MAG: hypothetical protein ACRCYR_00845 [Phycicoccus sp.]